MPMALKRVEVQVEHVVRRRLQDHLVLVVVLKPVRVLAVASVGGPTRRLRVGGVPAVRSQRAQRRRRVERARADLDVVGLKQDAALSAQKRERARMMSWNVMALIRVSISRVPDARTGRCAPWRPAHVRRYLTRRVGPFLARRSARSTAFRGSSSEQQTRREGSRVEVERLEPRRKVVARRRHDHVEAVADRRSRHARARPRRPSSRRAGDRASRGPPATGAEPPLTQPRSSRRPLRRPRARRARFRRASPRTRRRRPARACIRASPSP